MMEGEREKNDECCPTKAHKPVVEESSLLLTFKIETLTPLFAFHIQQRIFFSPLLIRYFRLLSRMPRFWEFL
jgi:hypothetical protein